MLVRQLSHKRVAAAVLALLPQSVLAQLVVGTMTNHRKHQDILVKKMRTLAIAHPGLLQALRKRYRLESEFEAEREKRYGD